MHRLIALVALIGCSSIVYGQSCGVTHIPPDLTIGATKRSEHIVGGGNAVPFSWPWQILLCRWNAARTACTFSCGGSIVDKDWIVTAGHCVSGQQNNPGLFGVKAAIYDQTCNSGNCMMLMNVSQVFLNPNYNGNTIDHDIAMIKLSTSLQLGLYIQPVCLPSVDDDVIIDTKTGWTTGWGTQNIGGGGATSQNLTQVLLPYVNSSVCNAVNYPNQITPRMVCAGRYGKDACQGDSGGPLVTMSSVNQQWYLYGITSWGRGCANEGYPGVWARTSAFCDFIAGVTSNQVQCTMPPAPVPTTTPQEATRAD